MSIIFLLLVAGFIVDIGADTRFLLSNQQRRNEVEGGKEYEKNEFIFWSRYSPKI